MMIPRETEQLIIQAVKELSQYDSRVFPRKVESWSNRRIGYAERTLRDFMLDMWRRGLLERPGGSNSRRGYVVVS